MRCGGLYTLVPYVEWWRCAAHKKFTRRPSSQLELGLRTAAPSTLRAACAALGQQPAAVRTILSRRGQVSWAAMAGSFKPFSSTVVRLSLREVGTDRPVQQTLQPL